MTTPSTIEIISLSLLFVALLILLLQTRVLAIAKQLGILSRIDAKLDLVLKQSGTGYDPYKNIPPDVADALRRGEKIQAIKLYRDATGVGLKEAKDFVEEVQRRAGSQ